LRGWNNGKIVKYSSEVRERAVRMVRDHEHEYPTRWAGACNGSGGLSHMSCGAPHIPRDALYALMPATEAIEQRAVQTFDANL
jgi:hypothetical protein